MGGCFDKYISAATWPPQIKIPGFASEIEYPLCIYLTSFLGLMSIYMCTQVLLSIRWGFDDDFYSLLVTLLQGVNGELSSQRYGSLSMLCNSLLPSDDGFARPCLATITDGTSLGISFVPAHDYI